MLEISKNYDKIKLFSFFCIFVNILLLCMSVVSQYPYYWVGDGTFSWHGGSDLFLSMMAARNRSPYSDYASYNPYPPLANLISYFFCRLVNIDNVGNLQIQGGEESLNYTGKNFNSMILLIDYID